MVKKVTFGQKSERHVKENHVGFGGRENNLCEGLVVRTSLAYLRNVKEDSEVVRSQDMLVLGRSSRDFV